MLKFQVFNEVDEEGPAKSFPLRHVYMIGSDHNPIRAEITFQDGLIICKKRESGTAALALQQEIGECGKLIVQTSQLPERDEPYLLNLELARQRLLLLYTKSEDWGLLSLSQDHPMVQRLTFTRRMFIEALCIQNEQPDKADNLARTCLEAAILAGEELALVHADLLLNRRKISGAVPQRPLGCGITLQQQVDRVRPELLNSIDFFYLHTPWRALAPEEGEYDWSTMDRWAQWAKHSGMPVIAGPIASFWPGHVPDWLFIWEHDYETVRDMVYQHAQRVITRYRDTVAGWTTVSGLHVNSSFPFSFEQLMELSRMTTMLAKKNHPTGQVLIEICQPFGEYYAVNQRSIPPLMYADLLIQSGINFDGFAIKLVMGGGSPGQTTRDLMQISHLLDQYASYGKPVTLVVTAPSSMVLAPTEPTPQAQPADPTQGAPYHSEHHHGYWRWPWTQLTQGQWLEAVLKIAMSKPFVEAVAWGEWADRPGMDLPTSGLIGEDRQMKRVFQKLASFRKNLSNVAGRSPTTSPPNRSPTSN